MSFPTPWVLTGNVQSGIGVHELLASRFSKFPEVLRNRSRGLHRFSLSSALDIGHVQPSPPAKLFLMANDIIINVQCERGGFARILTGTRPFSDLFMHIVPPISGINL